MRYYNEVGRARLIDSSKYTGAILRKLRSMRGVGRPPEVNLQRYGGAHELTPWRGPQEPLKTRIWRTRKRKKDRG